MRHKFTQSLSWVLLALSLQGCTQWQYNLGEPLSAEVIPTHDETLHLSEALLRLGPPVRLSSTSSGYVMGWEYWQIKENSLGFSFGFLGADLLSLDWGDAKVSGQFLMLSFDHDHRMLSADLSSWESSDAGGGSAIQPFFGAVSVVDVDDLTKRLPQHDWGRASLLRLPEAINSASSPDTGGAGIEQRGTPTGVGQRSLEMR